MLLDSPMSREKFDEYVCTYHSQLTQMARALAKRKICLFNSLAEDTEHAATMLLHETYIEALSTLESFDPVSQSFRSWFVKVMDKVLTSKERSPERKLWRQLAPSNGHSVEGEPLSCDPLDLLVSLTTIDPQDRYLVLDELKELLFPLSPPDRALIVFRFFYGMPAAEIARRLHWSPNYVSVRLSRVIKRLRALAQERRKEEEWSVKTRLGNGNVLSKNCCSAF